jgi:crotonobetainyl-CoA:carnitine CoA-transferase CaiB-like acyl-CoA transferase
MGLGVNIALLTGEPPVAPTVLDGSTAIQNPLAGHFKTADGRWINLTMLQPARYWADFCRHIDRIDLIDDDRFATAADLVVNAELAAGIVSEELAKRTLAEWIDRFHTLEGQWAPVHNALEVGQTASCERTA